MNNATIICGDNYKGWSLLNSDGNYSYRADILDEIINLMHHMFSMCSQVLVVRLVVRFPLELITANDNTAFSYFINEYTRYLRRNFAPVTRLWVKEQHDSHNCHYHLLLLINGNKMRYFNNWRKATELWALALHKVYGFNTNANGLIENCSFTNNGISTNHGIQIHRNHLALQQEIFKLCSYFAKTYTKGNSPYRVREFGSSTVKGGSNE